MGRCQGSTILDKNGVQDRYRQFVQNRVLQIRELTENLPWHHVPGEENPADLPTRGILPSDLKNNTFWTSGPNWLIEEESKWPKDIMSSISEPHEELRAAFRNNETSLLAKLEDTKSLDKILDEKRFSSIKKTFSYYSVYTQIYLQREKQK